MNRIPNFEMYVNEGFNRFNKDDKKLWNDIYDIVAKTSYNDFNDKSELIEMFTMIIKDLKNNAYNSVK